MTKPEKIELWQILFCPEAPPMFPNGIDAKLKDWGMEDRVNEPLIVEFDS